MEYLGRDKFGSEYWNTGKDIVKGEKQALRFYCTLACWASSIGESLRESLCITSESQ